MRTLINLKRGLLLFSFLSLALNSCTKENEKPKDPIAPIDTTKYGTVLFYSNALLFEDCTDCPIEIFINDSLVGEIQYSYYFTDLPTLAYIESTCSTNTERGVLAVTLPYGQYSFSAKLRDSIFSAGDILIEDYTSCFKKFLEVKKGNIATSDYSNGYVEVFQNLPVRIYKDTNGSGSQICLKDEIAEIFILVTSSWDMAGKIINFPEEAKQWEIPEKGLPVLVSGKAKGIETGEPHSPEINPIEFEITNIQKR